MIIEMEVKKAAGIVTFNPDIKRLEKCIKAINEQVDIIIIVDNASKNIQTIKSLSDQYQFVLLENKANKGMAYALNQCMQQAKERGYKWVITLDQDSVCPNNIISKSNKFINRKDVGIIVPMIIESKSGEKCYLGEADNGQEWQEVKKCITSAAITNVSVWEEVGGFDKELFIDYVDYDFAMKVRLNHYKIIRMNRVNLDHLIGNSELKRIFFHKIRIANHSAFRKYYIARNIVIYIKRYREHISVLQEILRLVKVLLLILCFENNKRDKIMACLCGIRDGMNYK